MQTDPENTAALRNRKFMSNKLATNQEDKTLCGSENRKHKLAMKLCSGRAEKVI